MWCEYLLLISITIMSGSTDDLLSISKRQINGLPLVFPYGAIYKLLLGFSLPVHDIDQVNMAFAVNFQYQYMQFMNISQLSQYYFIKEVSRETRDDGYRTDERLAFYRAVAEMMNAKGMNGYDCVQRAICESAQFPLDDEGFVGKIIHILLTPDYGTTPFDDTDPDWKEDMSPYIDAATAGRQMFSCAAIYTGCEEGQGIMEVISTLEDE